MLRIDHRTGTYEQLMTLERVYDGLASADGTTVFASSGQQLYRIDTENETETLVGSLPSNMSSLTFADESLLCLKSTGDYVVSVDADSGAALDSPTSIGTTDLSTIVVMSVDMDPSKAAKSYD